MLVASSCAEGDGESRHLGSYGITRQAPADVPRYEAQMLHRGRRSTLCHAPRFYVLHLYSNGESHNGISTVWGCGESEPDQERSPLQTYPQLLRDMTLPRRHALFGF